jgi:hypothetical protein
MFKNSSQGFQQESEHAVARDVAEGGEFEGVVAAGEFKSAGVGAMAAEGVEHLAGEFGEHGGIVSAVEHEGVATGTHATLDVRHRANGGPIFAELVDSDVVAKAFPDVVCGHTLADDVSVVGGDVEEAAGADAFIMDEGDIANGGADAGAEDAEFCVALLLEPMEAAAGVLDGLAVGLEGEADIGAADLVGALVAVGHASVVIRHAHFEHSDAHALNPVAEAVLAMPFGVPVGEQEDSGAGAAGAKELGVDGVIFGPGGFDAAGEGEDVFAVQAVIGGGGCGVPFAAGFNGILRILADEDAGIGHIEGAADVLEAPVKGLHAAIVVSGPAAVLVAADFAFQPIHKGSYQLSVYSCWLKRGRNDEKKQGITRGHKNRKKRNVGTERQIQKR